MVFKALQISAWFCTLVSTASIAVAGEPVNTYVHAQLNLQGVPGAAIAVIQDGRVVREVLHGYASVERKLPVRRSTLFQLASVTKVFTAITLMSLQHDGSLNLDDPVSKYLSGLPPPWRRVTLRELATHTSGLPDVIGSANVPLSATELARSETEALQFAGARDVLSAPGEQFHYDQTNYVLLKRIIEHVTGMEFRDVVATRILKPAMPNTTWGDARVSIRGRAEMYSQLKGDRVDKDSTLFTYPDYLEAAAGLNSSIADMEQFGAMLTSNRLLTRSELGQLWAPAKNHNGAVVDIAKDMDLPGVVAPTSGWFFADNSNGRYPRVFMTGGSAVSVVVFPKQELCIIVLTDLQAKDDPLQIAEGAAKFYIPGLQAMF